ncbi:MAG: Lacal_2735 family protein [Cryomorphaceae bacterium]|nr:Lacal_2735 family protein [Cryomorphaceae bacterium]
MFSFLKKKSPLEKLNEQYAALMKEAFNLSKVNRQKSDEKIAEAEAIMKEIEKLSSKGNH